jgi:hypothetical protein
MGITGQTSCAVTAWLAKMQASNSNNELFM